MLVTSVYGFLIVLIAVVAAVAGLLLAQRLLPLPLREQYNATTGIIYAAVYVLYGVVVGFSLFTVWNQFNEARQVAENEAIALERIHRLAERFPEPERGQIQELTVFYARSVVEEEWPSLQQGQLDSSTETLSEDLGRSVQEFEPDTDIQLALYSEALEELRVLEENRELRLLAVREGIPYILWVVLVVGGILTVAFTYLFGMRSTWLHAVAVAGLAIIISLDLHAIAVLDFPFNSGVRVEPDAFEEVLQELSGNSG